MTHSATFVAVMHDGEHICRSCSGFRTIDAANEWLQRQVVAALEGRTHSIIKFWYMLGENESQQYTPEEVEEVFINGQR